MSPATAPKIKGPSFLIRNISCITGVALSEAVIFHAYLTSFLCTPPVGYMGDAASSICSILCCTLVSIGLLLLVWKRQNFVFSSLIPAVVLMLGYLFGLLQQTLALPAIIVILVPGLSYGIGATLFRASWLTLFVRKDPREAVLSYAIALLGGCVISWALSVCSPILAGIILVSATCISAILALRLNRERVTQVSADAGNSLGIRKSLRLLAGPIAGVAVLEGIIGVLNITMFSDGHTVLFAQGSVWATRTAVVAICIAVIYITPRSLGPIQVFKACFPFTVAGLLLLALVGGSQGTLTMSILLIGYNLVWVSCMLLIVQEIAQENVHPYVAIGLFSFLTSIVLLGGFLLGTLLLQAGNQSNYTTLTLAGFASVYILALALLAFSSMRHHPQKPSDDTIARAFARNYNLAPRETDVLLYLVRGRSVAWIARQLDLSQNTVKGYTKSVYLKLDIHSREALMDKFDEFSQQFNTEADLSSDLFIEDQISEH